MLFALALLGFGFLCVGIAWVFEKMFEKMVGIRTYRPEEKKLEGRQPNRLRSPVGILSRDDMIGASFETSKGYSHNYRALPQSFPEIYSPIDRDSEPGHTEEWLEEEARSLEFIHNNTVNVV